MGAFRASSSGGHLDVLHYPNAGAVSSNDRASRRVRFASGVTQFDIPARSPNTYRPKNSAPSLVVPDIASSCSADATNGGHILATSSRIPLGARNQNIPPRFGLSSSKIHESPPFNPPPSPFLSSSNTQSSPCSPSNSPPLSLHVQRRVPASPEELQYGFCSGHYVGPPLQGPRIQVPALPVSPPHHGHQQQAHATTARPRTSSTLAPLRNPGAPCAASKSQRHSWPQYEPCSSQVPSDMVHYLLKGDSLLNWDIRQEPNKARIASDGGLLLSDWHGRSHRPELSERAVCKGLIQVEIDLPNLRLRNMQRTWGPIVVRSTPHESVSLKDLLKAIYGYFHRRLTPEELLQITPDPDLVQELKGQYAERYYLNDLTGVDAFRRSDILEGLTMFCVLDMESTQGEECYATLRLKS